MQGPGDEQEESSKDDEDRHTYEDEIQDMLEEIVRGPKGDDDSED